MAATLVFPTKPVFLSLIIIIINCLLSHQFHLTIAKPTTGFSLKLIHRHSPESPFYPGNNISAHQKIQQLVDISDSRVFELQSRITKTVAVDDIHPNIPRPRVGKFGYLYHVQIHIGTPPNPFYLALDTASSLIWIQCLPCEMCFPQRVPTFNPDHSHSYGTLPCNHPFCEGMTCIGGKCKYEVTYVGEQVTKGTMSYETFLFLSNYGAGAMEQKPIIFGCSNNNRNFDDFEGDGVLGMSYDRLSLLSQLSLNHAKLRFSYCLVPQDVQTNTHLRFGEDVKRRGIRFESTPFVPTRVPYMYGLNLMGISVDGNRIPLPDNAFALRGNGTGGCVIDSGASITYMDSIPYQTLRQVIRQHFAPYRQLRIITIEGLDLCYTLPRNFSNFPSLTFHFQDANLEVMPQNTFIINSHARYFCFAVKPIVNGPTLIGAIQQQYHRFVYDLSARKLRFVPDNCSDQ